jgi:hypothetical protein
VLTSTAPTATELAAVAMRAGRDGVVDVAAGLRAAANKAAANGTSQPSQSGT